MDCLDNLIALDHTCAGDSNPVMTLQSIGITEKNLAEIMNGDETPAMLLANVEQLARKVLRNDVITHFADRIIPRTIIDVFRSRSLDAGARCYALHDRSVRPERWQRC
jgi:hypothetical protein